MNEIRDAMPRDAMDEEMQRKYGSGYLMAG